MALDTYADLKQAVADEMDRKDLTDFIPDFIHRGEKRIFRVVRLPVNEVVAIFPAADNDNTDGTDLPPDYLESKLVEYNGKPLTRVSEQLLTRTRHQEENRVGEPAIFARINGTLEYFPIPETNEDVRLYYYSDQGPISDTNTPRLFGNSPALYLYAACREASIFIRDTERAQAYEAEYRRELAELESQKNRDEYSGSTLRTRSAY